MHTRTINLLFLLLLLPMGAFAQSENIIIEKGIFLPRDTFVKRTLPLALNAFLKGIQQGDFRKHIPDSQLAQSAVLIDEMRDIGDTTDGKSYKPHLISCVKMTDTTYLIQLACIGAAEQVPALKASYTFMALRSGGQYYFYAPLKYNTISWKLTQLGNASIYYKQYINMPKAKAYLATIAAYDKRLNARAQQLELYCADNFPEALRLIGVDYKVDYNGYAHNTLSTVTGNLKVSVDGVLTSDFSTFDSHDLWHERLRNVVKPSAINRPVDEGAAYLYGGSWGLSWRQILQQFSDYANANPGANWLALYNESKMFGGSERTPLNVDFAINALIIQRLEREKGMQAVMELLICGKKEAGNDAYFKALEGLTGITRDTFNNYVAGLVSAANKH